MRMDDNMRMRDTLLYISNGKKKNVYNEFHSGNNMVEVKRFIEIVS